MNRRVLIEFVINITDKDIDTITEKAKNGTAHWCSRFECDGSDMELKGHIENKIDPNNLITDFSHKDLIDGIELYARNPADGSILDVKDDELVIKSECITEEIADDIIQYALFGEIKYRKGIRI